MPKRVKPISTRTIDVPMAAMIDVVFLLLIYFIVTQKDELSEAHLAVNLPTPTPPPEQVEPPPPVLELEVHPGRVLLHGNQLPMEQITDMLAHFAKLDPEQTVIVKTSLMAQTRELVSVLDLCKGVGFYKLNVVTLK